MVNWISALGIAGAIVLALAWLPEILEIIKKNRSELNPKFAIMAFIGTILLLTYSILIRDIVFIIVNSFILFQVGLALYYEYFVEPQTKKRNKKKK